MVQKANIKRATTIPVRWNPFEILPLIKTTLLITLNIEEIIMTVSAKFKCVSVQKSPDQTSAVVTLRAVTTGSVENESWSKYTPSGQLQMVITNPDATDHFVQGKEYYIDIQPAGWWEGIKAGIHWMPALLALWRGMLEHFVNFLES